MSSLEKAEGRYARLSPERIVELKTILWRCDCGLLRVNERRAAGQIRLQPF